MEKKKSMGFWKNAIIQPMIVQEANSGSNEKDHNVFNIVFENEVA